MSYFHMKIIPKSPITECKSAMKTDQVQLVRLAGKKMYDMKEEEMMKLKQITYNAEGRKWIELLLILDVLGKCKGMKFQEQLNQNWTFYLHFALQPALPWPLKGFMHIAKNQVTVYRSLLNNTNPQWFTGLLHMCFTTLFHSIAL